MKIAQVTPGLIQIPPNGWGAIEKIIWAYKLGLEKLGHKVDIKYSSEINEGDYDIVHVHVANLAIDLAERGIPYVFTMHDHHVEVFGKFCECYQNNLKAIRKSIFSIVPSEHLIKYFENPPNLRYLPHGVDVNFFKAKDKEVSQSNHKLLCVGKNGYFNDENFDRKGFGLALQAAERLGLPLTVAGPKSNEVFFKSIGASYDKLNLVFDLTEEQLKEQYGLHTIFLHPSIVEAGHPNLTLLEAMSTGVPIVGTYTGIEFELNGILRIERDVDQIVEGIQKVIDDYPTYRSNAIDNANSLTWDYVVKRLCEYFNSPDAITPEAKVFADNHKRIYQKVLKKNKNTHIDKIFVINLEDRKDRKERISNILEKENLGVPIEIVNAVDIRNLKKDEVKQWLSKNNYSLYQWKTEKDDYFFDGYNFKEWDSRELTKGEIGCALSHYVVWKKAKEENLERILVLEDDAFWKNNGDLSLAIRKVAKCEAEFDLAYLGRTKITNSVEKSIDDIFNYSDFSYTTHAYIINKRGIKRFLSQNLQNNIIPADEFFSACVSNHRREDVAVVFPKVVKAIVPKQCFIRQEGIENQKESDVSDDRVFKMSFVDNPKLQISNQYVTNDLFRVDFILDNVSVYNTELQDNTWGEVYMSRRVPWEIKAIDLRSNEMCWSHKYNDEGQRVLIWFDSKSLGDNFAWIPQVERFRKISKSNVIVATFFNELFEKVYPEIKFIKPGSIEDSVYASYSIGCYDLDDKSKHINPWNKIPLGQICSDTLGIDYKEEKAKIHIKDKKNRLVGEKYVCISTSSTAGCKHWHRWQEVVDYLNSKGYRVVVIQKEPLNYMDLKGLENVIFPDTKDNIDEALAWLYNCEFYIGLSSGVSWLAHSIGKEVIMIAGFTEPYNEFTCRRVINYDVCHGCWHNHLFDKGDWNWCPEHKGTDREFECSKTIKLEDIIKVMPMN